MIACAARTTWHRSCVCRFWRRSERMRDGAFGWCIGNDYGRRRKYDTCSLGKACGRPAPARRSPPKVKVDGRPHGLAPGELVKLHHSLAESLNTGNGVVCQFIAPE